MIPSQWCIIVLNCTEVKWKYFSTNDSVILARRIHENKRPNFGKVMVRISLQSNNAGGSPLLYYGDFHTNGKFVAPRVSKDYKTRLMCAPSFHDCVWSWKCSKIYRWIMYLTWHFYCFSMSKVLPPENSISVSKNYSAQTIVDTRQSLSKSPIFHSVFAVIAVIFKLSIIQTMLAICDFSFQNFTLDNILYAT